MSKQDIKKTCKERKREQFMKEASSNICSIE
jgi:hypothetical protein